MSEEETNEDVELPEELNDVEKQIVAAVSARDIHVLTAVAYSVGEMYGNLKKETSEEELEEEYTKGYVDGLSDVYKGIINHINELTEQYKDYFDMLKPNIDDEEEEKIVIFDHQNETPQEEN